MKISDSVCENGQFLGEQKKNYRKLYKNVIRLGRCLFLTKFVSICGIFLYMSCFYTLFMCDQYWKQDKNLKYYAVSLIVADGMMIIQHIASLFAIINKQTTIITFCIIDSILSIFLRIMTLISLAFYTELESYKYSSMATIQTCFQSGFVILISELKSQWVPVPQRKWKKYFRLIRQKLPKIKENELQKI